MRLKLNRNYDSFGDDNFKTVNRKDGHQENSHQIHRYLREYQYNGCQPFGRKSLNDVQNKENILVNKQSSDVIPVKNRTQPIKFSTSQQKFSQKIDDRVIMSKQQIVLIKHLREQNQELKVQILKKNSYIEELQLKLQGCLQQRIQSLKQACEFNKELQSKLLVAEAQINTLQQELDQMKNELHHYQDSYSKIFNILGAKHKSILEKQQLQKMVKLIEQTSLENNMFDEFVRKIEEMKNKIQFKNNPIQSFNIKKNQIKIDLKQLWRWLKNVAKQYELIKQKVYSIQKMQVFSHT